MRALSSILACLTLLPSAALAQRQPDKAAEEPETTPPDPWAKDDPQAHERLGYLKVGRMVWGDRHDSARIQEDLGELPLIFIETAHFRLCCELPPVGAPRDKEERARLLPELVRLGEKLPRLRPKELKTLDPWLRAHLYAQRLEDLYTEVEELLGVSDADFPPAGQPFYFRGDAPPQYRENWMGRGPYLGNKGKFLVALFTKQSTSGRYVTTFTKAGADAPTRWYFEETDSFLFVTAVDFAEGAFRPDSALHAHVTHNLVHCLLDAYKGYGYVVPVWWKEGLAHWYRRRLTEKFNNFESIKDGEKRAYTVFNWDEIVRQRSKHDLVRPLAETIDDTACTDWDLIDHMACWSRMDFLITEFGRARMARFIGLVKGFVDYRGNPPTPEQLLNRQREALQMAFEVDAAGLDQAWKSWLAQKRRRQ